MHRKFFKESAKIKFSCRFSVKKTRKMLILFIKNILKIEK